MTDGPEITIDFRESTTRTRDLSMTDDPIITIDDVEAARRAVLDELPDGENELSAAYRAGVVDATLAMDWRLTEDADN